MSHVTFLELIILILASFRVARFFTDDTLLGRWPEGTDPGSGFHRWLDDYAFDENGKDRGFWRGKLGTLLTCPWCLGVWTSAIGWYLWSLDVPWLRAAAIIAAIAGAQGYIASRHNA